MRSSLLVLASVFSVFLVAPSILPAENAPIAVASHGGCAEPTPDPMPEGGGHSHGVPSAHAFVTTNMEWRGHVDPSLDGIEGIPPEVAAMARATEPTDHLLGGARFGEVDVLGKYAYLAMIGNPTKVIIVDVSDPANPKEVSRWAPGSGGYVTDLKALGKGEVFVAGTQYGSKNGLWLVDARDKANPKTMEFHTVSGGVHMISTLTIHGFEFIFANTASNQVIPVFMRVTDPLGLGIVDELRRVQDINTGAGAHDSWAWKDPIDGRNILFVANGPAAFRAYDVGFPFLDKPKEISKWSYAGTSQFYSHTVRASVVDGKRYVFLSPEGGALGLGYSHVARIHVLDVTDFAAPTLVGTWGNPGGHKAGSFTLSTHNIQVAEGRLYVAHYHGGVWVFDISSPATVRAPEPLGYMLPNRHPAASVVPDVWDVVVEEGRMYLADIRGGLYIARFSCDLEGPDGPTSVG